MTVAPGRPRSRSRGRDGRTLGSPWGPIDARRRQRDPPTRSMPSTQLGSRPCNRCGGSASSGAGAYRWNLRRLDLGFTLEIGCGIGRNLEHLDGNGIGIDHNEEAVRIAHTGGSPRTRRPSLTPRRTRSRRRSTASSAPTCWSTCRDPRRSSSWSSTSRWCARAGRSC